MYLFFDTETSGLPRSWRAPAADVDNWPRLVQIAWVAGDADGPAAESIEQIVRPDGFVISRQATQIHGITTARARREGVELGPVLDQFLAAARSADVLVAHNIEFDMKILQAELIRTGRDDSVFGNKRTVCTMKRSAGCCRLPGRYGYKWPTLSELHRHLFQEDFSGAHGALADTQACRRCFFRLQELGFIA